MRKKVIDNNPKLPSTLLPGVREELQTIFERYATQPMEARLIAKVRKEIEALLKAKITEFVEDVKGYRIEFFFDRKPGEQKAFLVAKSLFTLLLFKGYFVRPIALVGMQGFELPEGRFEYHYKNGEHLNFFFKHEEINNEKPTLTINKP